MIYCQTQFTRGAGLGTRLFPWARCTIFSELHNIPMLMPQWVQPRIGPLLRGGIDLSTYHRQVLLMGLFKKHNTELSGFKKWWVPHYAKLISEPANWDEISDQWRKQSSQGDVLVSFSEEKDKFVRLYPWKELLKQRILDITRPQWLDLVQSCGDIPIGINVRLGNDFRIASSNADYYTKGAVRTPLLWFIKSLELIREKIGYPARAIIVSNGSKEDLQELLAIENVEFLRPGCAISDLLVLANSKIFLSSGGSSFSAWASFLGQMPTVSHPGQSLEWFKLGSDEHFVGVFDPDVPDSDFLSRVEQIIG